ncbi:MFS-type transporter involved in bile tolerance (Atg22 family) [Scopulibacillus darangshiensis]|uniref:MFS-type transporter involved in bile tolerance (Atg22 family) n=1 Tax=Scopulibacillus darangshiensis TaxID=442528 RepID=A0A4R2NQN5_9BACL|nr:MFS transporter [Scopulibacillus darangshiensis]TCP23771.1 MFS-type transporter involved in bile tolerance (Atg22 family) [Scopulibacillus darangshiensis]
MGIPRIITSLGFKGFRLLWLSTALGNSGKWAFTVAASWAIFSLTHSTSLVGAVMFASMIPSVLFTPLAGVLADIFNRRYLYSFSLFISALATGCLAVFQSIGYASPYLIIVCSFLMGAAISFQMTCTNALMPDLVPKSVLYNASALQGSVQQGAQFLGSLLASPLLVLFGPNVVFILCFILYTSAGILSLWIHLKQPSINTESFQVSRLLRPIGQGFAYIINKRLIGLIILLVGLHCFLTMSYTSLLPEFISHHLNAKSGVYGTLVMFVGLGAMLGTLSTAAISTARAKGFLYVITAAGSGLSLYIMGFVHMPLTAFLIGIMIGGTQAVFMALSLSFVLERTDIKYTGRVAGAYNVTAQGLMAIANFLYGPLSKIIPPNINMMITGGSFVIIAVLFLALSVHLKTLYQKSSGAKKIKGKGVM